MFLFIGNRKKPRVTASGTASNRNAPKGFIAIKRLKNNDILDAVQHYL